MLEEFKRYKTRLAHGGIGKEVMVKTENLSIIHVSYKQWLTSIQAIKKI